MSITLRPPTLTATPRTAISIRARLLILALIAVVPLMVDRARLLEANRAERIVALSDEALALTRQGVDAQQEIVVAVKSLVQVVARAQAAFTNAPERCGPFLAGATSDAPWITGLSVIGLNGRIACSTVATRVGLDASDRPYFRAALSGKSFVIGDGVAARASGGVTLVGAAPVIMDNGAANGVIAAGFDLQWIERIGAETARRPGAMMLVLDGSGTVLAASPGRDKWLRKPFGHSVLAHEMHARRQGMITADGIDGVRRIFGFQPIPATDAWLAVGLDEAAVLRRVDGEIRMAYLQFALVGVIVLLGVWFGGEHTIVRPIRALARMANYIGHGSLSAAMARRDWAPEFAPLAAALDTMAKRLAEREEELRVASTHLDQLTRLDSLSGLANRRGFDARLEQEWQDSVTTDRPLALIMIDIDHFKSFNDRHGHVAGDMCLRNVGSALARTALDAAVVARYGGEEFALLFADTGMDGGLLVGEALRGAVERLGLAHAGAPSGRVTISVGVASLRASSGESSQILIEAADAALYAAKRRGRNTVVGHSPIAAITTT